MLEYMSAYGKWSVTHFCLIDRTKTYPFNYDSTKTMANKDDRPTPFLFSLCKPPASVAFPKKGFSWDLPVCRNVTRIPALLHGGGPCWCWCSQTFSQDPNHTRRRVFGHSVLRLARDLVTIAPLPGLEILGSLSKS